MVRPEHIFRIVHIHEQNIQEPPSELPALPRLKIDVPDVPLCIWTSLDAAKLPVESSGYCGMGMKPEESKGEYTSEELVENHGFKLVPWNGIDPVLILDVEGRIYGVLAGRPSRDRDWERACEEALDLILSWTNRVENSGLSQDNRRGNYPALSFGVSQGNGSQEPHRLKEGENADIVEKIRGHWGFRKIVTFATASFCKWAPNVYRFYKTQMAILWGRIGDLGNWAESAFPCATVNFGLQAVTKKHRDAMNFAAGWCAITALGRFNPERGGHMVIWDAKLVIEYPPGSTMLIPSAVITHSNTRIGEGETRVSFTEYAAGGLFRWMQNGFMTQDTLKGSKKKEDQELYAQNMAEGSNGARWLKGLSLFSNYSEFTET